MNDNQYTDDDKPDVYQRDHKARCAARTDLAAITKLERENAALKALLCEFVQGSEWYEWTSGGCWCVFCSAHANAVAKIVHTDTCPVERGRKLLGE